MPRFQLKEEMLLHDREIHKDLQPVFSRQRRFKTNC